MYAFLLHLMGRPVLMLTILLGLAVSVARAADLTPDFPKGLPIALEMRLKLSTKHINHFIGHDFPPNVTLGQILDRLGTLHDLLFDIDERAFQKAKGRDDFDVLKEKVNEPVPLPNLYHVSLGHVLDKVLSRVRLPNDEPVTYVVQGSHIRITTATAAARSAGEWVLGQPVTKFVWMDFPPNVNLGDVLARLQTDHGLSFVIDELAFRKVARDDNFDLLRQPLMKRSALPNLYCVDVAAVLDTVLTRIALPKHERVVYVFRGNYVLITTATEAARWKKQ